MMRSGDFQRQTAGWLCAAARLFFAMIIGLCAVSAPAALAEAATAPSLQKLTIGLKGDPDSLDPALVSNTEAWQVTTQLFDTLTAYSSNGSQVVPALAQSWTISDDRLTYTFNLRPNLTFHDGSPLNAIAVLYNFNRWWDTKNPQHNGSFPFFRAYFGGFRNDPNTLVASVSAPNPGQFLIEMKSPDSLIPAILATPAFAIVSPASLQSGTSSTVPVGSGPYRFISHLSGVSVQLEAYNNFWGGRPVTDSLDFRVLPDDAARFAALVSNSIDTAGSLPDTYIITTSHTAGLKLLSLPSTDVGYLGINQGHPPLDDVLVRQAIAHAISKPNLINSHYSAGTQAATDLLPPIVWGMAPSQADYSYDPALARSLLAQAGYPLGIAINLAYPTTVTGYLQDPTGTALALKADLQAANIFVILSPYDPATFVTKLNKGELDLWIGGWAADYLHPYNFYQSILCTGLQSLGPVDKQICNPLATSLSVFDPAVTLSIYQGTSQLIHDELPVVPLVHSRGYIVTRGSVSGLQAASAWKVIILQNAFLATSLSYLPAVAHP